MKLRSYERYTLFYCLIIIFFLFVLGFIIYTVSFRIYEYESIDGVMTKEGLVEAFVSKEEMKCLYKSKYIFFKGKKIKFKLEEVILDFFKSNDKVYDKVLIEIDYDKKIDGGEVVEFSIKNKKVLFIKIYEVIWKGE